jgi:hypothetical protein
MKDLFRWCLVALAFALLASNAQSQVTWKQTNGPFGGSVNSLFVTQSTTIYALMRNGWYVSYDHKTWARAPFTLEFGTISELRGQTPQGTLLASFIGNDSVTQGLAYSSDDGLHWDSAVGGFNSYSTNTQYYPLYSSSYGDLRQSTDDGRTWVSTGHNGGLSFRSARNTFFLYGRGYQEAYGDDRGHFIGYRWVEGNSGRSVDTGKTYSQVLSGTCWAMVEIDSLLLAFVSFGEPSFGYLPSSLSIFVSSDDGRTWTPRFPSPPFCIIVKHGRNLIGVKNNGALFQSSDIGITWDSIGASFETSSQLHCLVVDSIGRPYVALDNGFRGLENGTWQFHNAGFLSAFVGIIGCDRDHNLYALSNEQLWFTSDGDNWLNASLPPHPFSQFPISKQRYFVGCGTPSYNEHGVCPLFRSIDLGATWIETSVKAKNLVAISDDTLFAADTLSIFMSVDGGISWTKQYSFNSFLCDISVKNHVIYAAVGNDVPVYHNQFLESSDFGVSWKPSNGAGFAAGSIGDSLILQFAGSYNYHVLFPAIDSIRYLGAGDGPMANDSGGSLYMSSHQMDDVVNVFSSSSQTWQNCANNLPKDQIMAISAGPKGKVYVATANHSVWRTATADELDVATNRPSDENRINIEVIQGKIFVVISSNLSREAELNLFDERGICVRHFAAVKTDEPVQYIQLPNDLRGAYWLRLIFGERSYVRGIILY